ncbi:glycosyltransferase family 4 protein [Halorarum salinum]|uniref:Glycosyltransferase family 4 protein n=1 Tax=Halorarum salinum TaxID=2743089 RepID=A0A7D5L8J9_9EURY|nr:glycosyltransferase family 4 protein [Halobaculum salinum]QLG60427.1 glycosyltransferase family 4 protein [Halobaculum salinum]
MRVLQAAHALPPDTYGGVELYTVGLSEALAARGHDVAVAAPGGGADLDVTTFDLPTPDPPDVQADRGLPTGPVNPAVDGRFDDLLASFDPDVVHLQHFKGLSAAIPALCAERGVACVATLHDFWTICHREQLHRPDGSRCSGPESVEKCTDCYLAAESDESAIADGGAGSAGEPRLGADADGGRTGETGATRREQYATVVTARTALLRTALGATDVLVSPSSFLRDRFVAHGTPPGDVVQLRNGIRVDRFVDTGFEGAPVRFGYAGRITPEKGVHLLVEAFDELDGDATLDVFGRFASGEDPYHADLAEAAGERVRFRGFYDDPAAPYRAMDVLVLPSIWYENSPLVIQEARAAGLPVVTADVGGMAELVTDGVDGLTFPVGDAAALAGALSGLVDDATAVERLRAGVEPPTRLDEHAAAVEALYADCASA